LPLEQHKHVQFFAQAMAYEALTMQAKSYQYVQYSVKWLYRNFCAMKAKDGFSNYDR